MIRPMLCFFLCLPLLALGDAMITTRAMTASTIAEVFIERDQVRVELEIGMSDILGFRNILPDAIYEGLGDKPEPIAQRIDRFFKDDFVVEIDGEIVPGRIRQMAPRKRIIRDDITGEPLPIQGEGEDVIFSEFVFPLAGPAETFSIKPPQNEHGFASTGIGFMVYHLGLPVMDFRYLSQKESLHLDWDDPWFSQFESKNLRREYNEPISLFLYAEPFEIRVEVIVRPKDIQQWHDLGIEGVESIPVGLQPNIKAQIVQFLIDELQLTIDGKRVIPELQRIGFLRRTLKSSMVIDPPEELDANSAMLGVIYAVPTESLPQEARVTWTLFSPKMQVVRAAATDEAGPMPYKLSPDDNVLVWMNYLTNPTVPTIKPLMPPETTQLIRLPMGTVVCLLLLLPVMFTSFRKRGSWAAGAAGGVTCACAVLIYPYLSIACPVPARPEPTDEAVTNLVSGLLENVYTSFDFREESTIYDALDQSLVGELLTDVYLQTKKSLELASQGGAQVQVKGIDLESVAFEPRDDGVMATCTWNVMGSVGHWGHIHQRVNRYTARLNIQPLDGVWKIKELEMLDEERVK